MYDPISESRSWSGAIVRCHDPQNPNYKNYGARGIYVCDRWRGLDGFFNFINDMGVRPNEQYSLDRIDNDGPYAPDNCRWATKLQQARNTRRCKIITIDGKSKTMSEWISDSTCGYRVIKERIAAGWDPKKAIFQPTKRTILLKAGDKFNSWTVTGYIRKDQKNKRFYECMCDCQKSKAFIPKYALESGKSKQCKSCATKKRLPKLLEGQQKAKKIRNAKKIELTQIDVSAKMATLNERKNS